MKPLGPILVVELFPELRRHLLELLSELTPDEWNLPTAARLWNVKDVALHLLGGDLGILSRKRDGFTPPGRSIEKWEDLVAFINELNDQWLQATRRLSSRVLCELLAYTGPCVEEYFASLDPFALGDPVDWAGSERAPVWLDLAREYTERWHHQQQIRDAASRPGLYSPRLFAPAIDAFVRALPRTFRGVSAPENAVVELRLEGPGGGSWCLQRKSPGWSLFAGDAETPSAGVTLTARDAWKLFTRGLSAEQAMERVTIRGDKRLGAKVLETVSVIA